METNSDKEIRTIFQNERFMNELANKNKEIAALKEALRKADAVLKGKISHPELLSSIQEEIEQLLK